MSYFRSRSNKTIIDSMDIVLSKNEEDYLKALFQITVESNMGVAGTNQLALNLGVSPASVNGMIKKIEKQETG